MEEEAEGGVDLGFEGCGGGELGDGAVAGCLGEGLAEGVDAGLDGRRERVGGGLTGEVGFALGGGKGLEEGAGLGCGVERRAGED